MKLTHDKHTASELCLTTTEIRIDLHVNCNLTDSMYVTIDSAELNEFLKLLS